MTSMSREQQVSTVFVQVADSLIDDFDLIEFLEGLCAHCVSLLDVSAVGILLANEKGLLHTIAASDQNTHLLELFAIQHDEGPCLDCYRAGDARINIDLHDPVANETWPAFADQARRSGFQTSHVFPLRLRDRAVGAMNLFHTGRQSLTPPGRFTRPGARGRRDDRHSPTARPRTGAVGEDTTATCPVQSHRHRTGQGDPRRTLERHSRRGVRRSAHLCPSTPTTHLRLRPPHHRPDPRHRRDPARLASCGRAPCLAPDPDRRRPVCHLRRGQGHGRAHRRTATRRLTGTCRADGPRGGPGQPPAASGLFTMPSSTGSARGELRRCGNRYDREGVWARRSGTDAGSACLGRQAHTHGSGFSGHPEVS